jgi:hypothetical protein
MFGSTDAKTFDHDQRRAIVVLKRKMRNHHVKIFRVIQPLRAKVINLIGTRMLSVQKSNNFGYRVSIKSFNLGEFRFGHRRGGVVGEFAHIAAWEAHGNDVFLERAV